LDGTTDSTFNWTITYKDIAFSLDPSSAVPLRNAPMTRG
jgi:hypothetical protein